MSHRRYEQLENKISTMEDQLRQNNLVFYGIPEGDRESWSITEEKVQNVLKDNLEMDTNGSEIEKAYRVGQKRQTSQRPIIVKFSNWKIRSQVKEKAREHLHQDSNIRIGEDYSHKTREIHRKLYPKMRDSQRQGKQAYIRHNKLFIENVPYVVNENDEVVIAQNN